MASQIDSTPDVQPLATFRDNPTELILQLKKTRRPIALTVDGKPEVVLQDPAEYEHMLDLLEAAKKTIEKKPGTLHVSDDAKFIALPYMTRYHAELSKELERVATIITFLNTTPRTSMEIPSAAKAEEPILINDYIPPIIAAPNTDDAQENDTNLEDTKSSMRTVGSTESLTSSASNANPSTPATLDGSKKKKKKKKPGAKQNDDDNDGDET